MESLGELVLHPDGGRVAVERRQGTVVIGFITPGSDAGEQLGALTPGVGQGHDACQFVIAGQRVDVIAGAVVAGFIGQGGAFSKRAAPVACERIKLLRAVGSDHAGFQHFAGERRAFNVFGQQPITTGFGLALPAQAQVGILTIRDDVRVG
ncbi:hypothetical protein D3C81_1774170 [compost metagenome]